MATGRKISRSHLAIALIRRLETDYRAFTQMDVLNIARRQAA